jgi:hypothetical protein
MRAPQLMHSAAQIRLTAKESRAIYTAKRLAMRTVLEDAQVPPALLTFSPASSKAADSKRLFPVSYSLYPFTPSRPLPWTAGSNRVFRARRVGEWLGIDSVEDVLQTGGLQGGKGSIAQLDGEFCALRDLLTESLPPDATLAATIGHMLIPCTPAQRNTLAPPLQGNCAIGKITQFIRTHPSAPFFVSSLPLSLLTSNSGSQSVTHRLMYQTFPTLLPPEEEQKRNSTSKAGISLKPQSIKFMKWEINLPSERGQDNNKTIVKESATLSNAEDDIDQDEITSVLASSNPTDADAADNVSDLSPPRTDFALDDSQVFKPTCKVGQGIVVNMMLPDRPLDLQFSATSEAPMRSGEEPFQLQEYLSNLETL